MTETLIPLLETKIIPTFNLKKYGYTATLHTGIECPIFSLDEKQIKEKFGGEEIKGEILLTTYFSNEGIKGKLYRVYNFKLSNITYKELDVFVPDTPLSPEIIIGVTMFADMNYRVDTINHTLRLKIPNDVDTKGIICHAKEGLE